VDSFGDGSAFLFVVPANVAGRWTFRAQNGERFEVELEQSFQYVQGTANGAAVTGKLAGDGLELTFVEGGEPVRITGTVSDRRIAATVRRGASSADHVGVRQ
jgi:hypothetical protein